MSIESVEVMIHLEDRDGRSFKGRFPGKLLFTGEDGINLYQKDEVEGSKLYLIHDTNERRTFEYDEDGHRGGVARCLPGAEYAEAMHAIGAEPVINV